MQVVKTFYIGGFILLMLVFIVTIIPAPSPTGFVIEEDSVITPEVQQQLYEKGKVEVIIQLKDVEGEFFLYDNKKADIEEVKKHIKYGFREGKDFENLDAFSGTITQEGLERLEKHPNVEFVQLDHVFSIDLTDSIPLIDADILHNKTLINNLTGKNIGVCILDTGMNYSHQKLSDNYAGGYDFVNSDSNPLDDHGHGTHVSGIVEGVAPESKILHVKVLNSGGSGSESNIVAGVNWCISNKDIYNIKVITMSLGAGLFSQTCDSTFPLFSQAVNNALIHGIAVIASSGNEGSTIDISAPACFENVTAVSATDKNDNLAPYANRNILVDLLAPGSNILSTALNGGYTTMSGTSMAAPHVAASFVLAQQFEFEESGVFLIPSILVTLFKTRGINISNWTRIDVDNVIRSLDDHSPHLLLSSPNVKNYSEKDLPTLNYSAQDIFLERVWYNLNRGQNTTIESNKTLSLEGGSYVLNLYANDSKGNENSTSVAFSVNLLTVTLHSPEDNYNDLDGYVEFNCSLLSSASLSNLSLYTNHTGVWHSNQTTSLTGTENSTLFSLNISERTSFIWNCLGFDTTGDSDFGVNRTIRININNAPEITAYFPLSTHISLAEPSHQTFNISYRDSDGDSVSPFWYQNGEFVGSTDTYISGGNYLTSGTYNITIFVNDSTSSTSHFWNFSINNTEICGDNVKNSTEICDGIDLNGETCTTRGFSSGILSCTSDCSAFVIENCSNTTSGSGGGGSTGEQEKEIVKEQIEEFTQQESLPLGSEDAVFSEEEAVDIKSPSSKEENEKSQEEISEIEEMGKDKIGKILGSAIGVVVASLFLYFFLRKEWKYIRNRKM